MRQKGKDKEKQKQKINTNKQSKEKDIVVGLPALACGELSLAPARIFVFLFEVFLERRCALSLIALAAAAALHAQRAAPPGVRTPQTLNP